LFEQGITSIADNLIIEEPEKKSKSIEMIVTCDNKIKFLNYDIHRIDKDKNSTEAISIEFSIKNTSNLWIGGVLFGAVLYDRDGKILDTIQYKTKDIKPNAIRNLQMNCSGCNIDNIKCCTLKVIKIIFLPESTVTGNDKIIILKHYLTTKAESYFGRRRCVDFSIRNISEITIATIIFEAVFYDIEGNILDTVRHTEVELKPNISRTVFIVCDNTKLFEKISGYKVRIVKMVTADAEKVQLRLQEARTTGAGEEEIRGRVKNISTVRTDSALVANFFNRKKEDVGTKVVIIRNIEPGEIRQFRFKFKPQPGDKVDSYTLTFGEIAE
jgi:hypothetical protein